jgi:hypothetical protein
MSQLGGTNMPPRAVSFLFEEVGARFPIKFLLFPSISHQNPFISSSSKKIPIKFLFFPTITHQNPFVPIRFPSGSHQILLIPFNNGG